MIITDTSANTNYISTVPSSRMLRCDHENDTPTQHDIRTATMRHKIHSLIADESPPILPDDIVVAILLRLPVRSLLQFRCVCKSWKTLISDPQFAENQLQLFTVNPTIAHQHLSSSTVTRTCKIVSFPVKPLFANPSSPVAPISVDMNGRYHILGSCNGLLCLYEFQLGCVRLWNPSTRLMSKTFAVIDDIVIRCYGFGYDPVNHKYKVLVVMSDCNEPATKLYAFGENSWKTIQDFPGTPPTGPGKHVNGTLNWFPTEEGFDCNQWVILTFDLVKETYGKLSLPKQDNGGSIFNPVLDVLSNCLCVCFDHSGTLWLMKQYGVTESWTKLMIIPRGDGWQATYQHSFRPLCILENGIILGKTPCSGLVRYDTNTGMYNYPRILGKLGLKLHVYHESLVSPLC